MPLVKLEQIAYARSGDKGASANVAVIAYTPQGYEFIKDVLTSEKMLVFFHSLNPSRIERYEVPNLGALNFVLEGVLAGGGSRSLRMDAQGKALGQAVLQLTLEIPDSLLSSLLPSKTDFRHE